MRVISLLGCLAFAFSWLPAAAQWRAEARPEAQPGDSRIYKVPEGTRILLELSSVLKSKNAAEGDCVYFRTVHPVNAGGRIVIPPGSYVTGTITSVKRAKLLNSPGEFHMRFDSLLLPNGVSRELHGRLLTVDGGAPARVDRTEGKVRGEERDIANAAVQAAIAGAAAGAAGGLYSRGVDVKRTALTSAIFGGAVLLGGWVMRGPEATLLEGTKVVMILDRPLNFEERDLEGISVSAAPARSVQAPAPRQPEPRTSRQFPFPYGFPFPFPFVAP